MVSFKSSGPKGGPSEAQGEPELQSMYQKFWEAVSDAGKMKHKTILIVLLLGAACGIAAAPTEKWGFGPWQRASDAPILSPQGTSWESAGTFNPAVMRHNGKFVMLYRAQDAAGTSRLGYAESTDGIHFARRAEPVLSPETEYEKDGGVEDPRLQKFGDTYYLTYTGYNKKDAQLCLATSPDLVNWERKGVILPAYKGNWNKRWTKSGAIVPEQIDGKYWMYWLGTSADKTDQMGLSFSTDLLHWTEATQTPVLPSDANSGAAATPWQIRFARGRAGAAADSHRKRNRARLQRRRRQTDLPRRSRGVRSQGSPQAPFPHGHPDLQPGERLGESWPGTERCLRGRDGASGKPLAFLLRRSGQVRGSGRGTHAVTAPAVRSDKVGEKPTHCEEQS